MALHGTRPVTEGDIYALRRAGHLKLGSCGAIVTGSKERIRAQLIGTEPDQARVGAAGDLLTGGRAVADFINELLSTSSAAGAP
jgi:hypothetical protein